MLYRSLVVGLLGAIALLVASLPAAATRPQVRDARAAVAPRLLSPPVPEATVVDVSRARAGADVMPLLGLAPGDRIVTIDGAPADGVLLAAQWQASGPGTYLDVGVRGPRGDERRILVLVHP